MKAKDKTKEKLIEEVTKLRMKISELKESGIKLKKTEKALQQSEVNYRNLIELAPDAILTVDLNGTITSCNSIAIRGTGYSKEDIVGNHISRLRFLPPEDISKYMSFFKYAIKGKKLKPFEVTWNHKDGTPYLAEIRAGIIQENGKTMGVQIVGRDITERKRVEEEREKLQVQLIQSEKMAGIGTLASGIAHEFNNLLQIMSGHVQIAERTKKTEDVDEAFEIVLLTTDRASKIIGDLLTFSRSEEAKKRLCSITEPLEAVLSMTKDQLKKNNIKIMREYGRLSKLKINKGEMQQVFLNMVTNARDAMFSRGEGWK